MSSFFWLSAKWIAEATLVFSASALSESQHGEKCIYATKSAQPLAINPNWQSFTSRLSPSPQLFPPQVLLATQSPSSSPTILEISSPLTLHALSLGFCSKPLRLQIARTRINCRTAWIHDILSSKLRCVATVYGSRIGVGGACSAIG